MVIMGYARVSTKEQNLDLQLDALKKAECTEIFSEKYPPLKNTPNWRMPWLILKKSCQHCRHPL